MTLPAVLQKRHCRKGGIASAGAHKVLPYGQDGGAAEFVAAHVISTQVGWGLAPTWCR